MLRLAPFSGFQPGPESENRQGIAARLKEAGRAMLRSAPILAWSGSRLNPYGKCRITLQSCGNFYCNSAVE